MVQRSPWRSWQPRATTARAALWLLPWTRQMASSWRRTRTLAERSRSSASEVIQGGGWRLTGPKRKPQKDPQTYVPLLLRGDRRKGAKRRADSLARKDFLARTPSGRQPLLEPLIGTHDKFRRQIGLMVFAVTVPSTKNVFGSGRVTPHKHVSALSRRFRSLTSKNRPPRNRAFHSKPSLGQERSLVAQSSATRGTVAATPPVHRHNLMIYTVQS